MRVANWARSVRRHDWRGWIWSAAILACALALRFLIGSTTEIAFITIFPAIVLSALIGGLRAGIAVAIVAGLVAKYFWVPHLHSFALAWPGGVLSLGFYILTSAILLYVVRTLNLSVDQLHARMEELAAERDRSAELFRELQHRSANNLQFVAGLLRHGLRRAGEDPAAIVKATRDAETRIEIMGRINRRLYDPEASGRRLADYFEELARDIVDAAGARGLTVEVEVPVELTFSMERVMTVSLIVSELVTNAIKHAFEDGKPGRIVVSLDRAGDLCVLTIADDGRGLPAGFDPRASRSLGSRVMLDLVQRLGGTLAYGGGRGTTATVTFPYAGQSAAAPG